MNIFTNHVCIFILFLNAHNGQFILRGGDKSDGKIHCKAALLLATPYSL